ncbi:N-acetylglucosamine kinase [Gryllotalpicola ginsengisoli]|uniref:N-acetylglucosamine kinase n=1 Tax=Gryllotalpicola ginsengisoli TaxID=444608 RepID=UPI0003B7635B|nr:BadF/BadG/BcrA/BcrD ATPase family protein [Gryllotalpicola ginsengisoli]
MAEFLAVDAGGTTTRAVVVDAAGRCLGFAKSGSGNPISAGPHTAAASVAAATAEALTAARTDPAGIRHVVLAMAGASGLTDREVFARPLRELGVAAAPVFRADLLATFFSGTWHEAGYALVAGTGAAAIRVEGGDAVRVADALGWLLGDDGSGFWIGHRVARAVFADLDGRGPATALTPGLLAALGVEAGGGTVQGRRATVQRAMEAVYAMRPVELARFARLAFEAAGDAVADEIVAEAADALVRTLDAVAAPGVTGPIVLGGGTLVGHPTLVDRIAAARAGDGGAPEVRSVADGVVGAAVLALREGGVAVDASVFAALTRSLAALR